MRGRDGRLVGLFGCTLDGLGSIPNWRQKVLEFIIIHHVQVCPVIKYAYVSRVRFILIKLRHLS